MTVSEPCAPLKWAFLQEEASLYSALLNSRLPVGPGQLAKMTESSQSETLVGRKRELRELRAAIQKGESRLIWGPMDAGKTALIQEAISGLPGSERRKCVYYSGTASGRQLLSHLIGQLYELEDSLVRKKVHADGAAEPTLSRWLHKQTSLRLRGILFSASTQGDYRFFVDHFPPLTHNMARLMKEIMFRCKTPIYLAARNYSQNEIGFAWSLYWNDTLRVNVGPLNKRTARELLEICIREFRLDMLDLEDFREGILRLSGYLPGPIVKMCKLAADSKYRYGDRIKIKLVHVDYLMHSNSSAIHRVPAFFQ